MGITPEVEKTFNARLAEERRKFEKKSAAFDLERKALEEAKERMQHEIQEATKKAVQAEKPKIEARIRRSVEDETSEQLKSMQKELSQKSEQVKELNRARSDIERLKREKGELKDAIEAETQKKLNEQLLEERGKIQKTIEDRVQLKISEKDNIIEQLRVQLQEAHRKAEQGSTQLQGEVQELAIEEWLRTAYPLDTIGEVKKGARGADCLQTVNITIRENCGSIYYESKRTKDFQPAWIGKFKEDMRAKGANVGVMVTEAMPKDMERMGLKEGIWICSFEEFKGLSAVLRESIVQVSNAVVAQENKGEKMNMLYDYLTSNEFKLQIEAIVEGFTQMQTDLNSEKRTMESAWKRREKQIDRVLLSTNHMYSSIKGIAGAAIPVVPQLELKSQDDPKT